jgi:tetratricopeptide (TPR) repeat protein
MNHGVLASAAFELGFCLLWAWRPLEAELELRRGLTLAESVGDVTVQTRCLTYLALAARIRGEVDGARALADRTLEAAEAGGMIEYVAQSHANLAWADWRSGDLVAAERHAKEAWELWQRVPYAGFPTVQWVATWPLIVVLLAHGRAAQAVPHARALLDPDRQPMPDELRTALASAVATWDDGDPETAKRMLESATALAAEHRYL